MWSPAQHPNPEIEPRKQNPVHKPWSSKKQIHLPNKNTRHNKPMQEKGLLSRKEKIW
jgi:hypothetical protein